MNKTWRKPFYAGLLAAGLLAGHAAPSFAQEGAANTGSDTTSGSRATTDDDDDDTDWGWIGLAGLLGLGGLMRRDRPRDVHTTHGTTAHRT